MFSLIVFIIMGRERPFLLPRYSRLIGDLGENLKLARLRRRLSAQQVAERANISRPTLLMIEKGEPGVSLGNLLRVLAVLGLEEDLRAIAADDVLGRKLQDAGLDRPRKRAPKRSQGEENP
jgi:transcriptional regulator with XRE-family HTH domain